MQEILNAITWWKVYVKCSKLLVKTRELLFIRLMFYSPNETSKTVVFHWKTLLIKTGTVIKTGVYCFRLANHYFFVTGDCSLLFLFINCSEWAQKSRLNLKIDVNCWFLWVNTFSGITQVDGFPKRNVSKVHQAAGQTFHSPLEGKTPRHRQKFSITSQSQNTPKHDEFF